MFLFFRPGGTRARHREALGEPGLPAWERSESAAGHEQAGSSRRGSGLPIELAWRLWKVPNACPGLISNEGR